jgi:hypothetical protein
MEVLTREDLRIFKLELIVEIQKMLREALTNMPDTNEGYKTRHVREILGCSVNKLVTLRIARKIRVVKIGGTLYYNKEDVKNLLKNGY